MPIKLNSFTLPDNIIEMMGEYLYKTYETKQEYGFNICNADSTLIDKDHCKGTACYVAIKSKCTDQEKTPKVGDYHTHPKAPARMSVGDQLSSCRRETDFQCIGSAPEGLVRCFVKKKNTKSENDKCVSELIPIEDESYTLRNDSFNINDEHAILIKTKYDIYEGMSSMSREEFKNMANKFNSKLDQYKNRLKEHYKKEIYNQNKYFNTIEIK